jgi:4-hydroxy-tetrahydrodipicolinate synthase
VITPEDLTVYAMVATPFTSDGDIDLDAFSQLVDQMCQAGVGIYLGSGGAGEGHALTLPELSALYRTGVEVVAGRVPVAANPPEPRTARAMLGVATAAADAGVDLVQLYSPDPGHAMEPTRAELDGYYRFLLERLDCRIALSVHANSSYRVPPDLLAALCGQFPSIEAINIVMPIDYHLEIQDALAAAVDREIRLYTSMRTMVDGLLIGCHGLLAAEPNLIPFTMQRLARSVIGDGTREETARLHRFVLELGRGVKRWHPSTARWIKMGLLVLGGPGGNGVLREPYVLPPAAEIDRMRELFDRLRVAEIEAESRAHL